MDVVRETNQLGTTTSLKRSQVIDRPGPSPDPGMAYGLLEKQLGVSPKCRQKHPKKQG